MGNTKSVARRHYLQVTEEHFAAALQPAPFAPPQQPAASGDINRGDGGIVEKQSSRRFSPDAAVSRGDGESGVVTPTGSEQPAETLGKTHPDERLDPFLTLNPRWRGVEKAPETADLPELIDLWPGLDNDARAVIVEFARTYATTPVEGGAK